MPSSLFVLLDDITVLLDDVLVLSKAATMKTAGVLGDDLALNAQQVAGVKPERELPVVWAVAKGSLLNKAIIVPAAFIISLLAPWLILPLLLVGGDGAPKDRAGVEVIQDLKRLEAWGRTLASHATAVRRRV